MKLNCIAIDDEPLALEIVERFCNRLDDIDIKTFSETGTALEEINNNKPDIVFLDIEMNEVNGIQFASKLPKDTCIILTSAYLQYAIDGFNIDAVDFLHKPFSFDRFTQAVDKAKRRMGHDTGDSKIIIVKQDYNNIRISTDNIRYIEAMENYSKIHLKDGKISVAHHTLKNLMSMLPENLFIRIHKSFLAPVNDIESFTRGSVRLKDDISLPVGRQYAKNLFES